MLSAVRANSRRLQTAVARILNAIFEADFLDHSFGYRPKTGAKKAVQHLTRSIQFGRFTYVLDADIKGFFDNLNHDWLIRMLEQRIDDKPFVRLIQKWLNAGILHNDGTVHNVTKGSPQGGIVSPMLANILRSSLFRIIMRELLYCILLLISGLQRK